MLLKHVDNEKESFRFTEDMVRKEGVNDAFDPARGNQIACSPFEIAQRRHGNPVLIQKLIKNRNGLGLGAHGFDIPRLE